MQAAAGTTPQYVHDQTGQCPASKLRECGYRRMRCVCSHRGPLSHEGLGGCSSCAKYRVPGRMTTGEYQHVVDIVMPVAKEPQDCYISPSLEQGGPILKCVCVSLMAKHRLHRPQRFACLRQKKGFADLHAHFPPLLSVCSRQGSFKSKTTTFMARATVSS